MKIRGNTVGTPTPRSNWTQTDPTKADYILNKPSPEELKGPKGDTGPQGEPGPKGEPGPSGSDANVTAENITAALGYAPGMVNPNLLDNWYFLNPVNQRGKKTYSGAWTYTIDRWRLGNTENSVSVGSGVTLNNAVLVQHIEFSERLAGKMVTMSVLTNGGILETITGTVPDPIPEEWVRIAYKATESAVFDIYAQGQMVSASVGAEYTATTFIASKLELGEVQTLAHRDTSGRWVLNEIPDYGEQLARCQRFSIPIKGDQAQAYVVLANGMYFNIPVPVMMRDKPVISGTFTVKSSSGVAQDGFDVSVFTRYENCVVLKAVKTAHGLTSAYISGGSSGYASCDL